MILTQLKLSYLGNEWQESESHPGGGHGLHWTLSHTHWTLTTLQSAEYSGLIILTTDFIK